MNENKNKSIEERWEPFDINALSSFHYSNKVFDNVLHAPFFQFTSHSVCKANNKCYNCRSTEVTKCTIIPNDVTCVVYSKSSNVVFIWLFYTAHK